MCPVRCLLQTRAELAGKLDKCLEKRRKQRYFGVNNLSAPWFTQSNHTVSICATASWMFWLRTADWIGSAEFKFSERSVANPEIYRNNWELRFLWFWNDCRRQTQFSESMPFPFVPADWVLNRSDNRLSDPQTTSATAPCIRQSDSEAYSWALRHGFQS